MRNQVCYALVMTMLSCAIACTSRPTVDGKDRQLSSNEKWTETRVRRVLSDGSEVYQSHGEAIPFIMPLASTQGTFYVPACVVPLLMDRNDSLHLLESLTWSGSLTADDSMLAHYCRALMRGDDVEISLDQRLG